MNVKLDPQYLALSGSQRSDVDEAILVSRVYRGLDFSMSLRYAYGRYATLQKLVPGLGKGSPQEDDFYILDAVVSGVKLSV
jgi:hypothetical protein